MSATTSSTAGASHGRRSRWRLVTLIAGIACIIAGVALIAGPLYGVWHRDQFDQNAINAWQNGGEPNLAGPAKDAGATGNSHCGSANQSDYAFVSFGGSVQQYNYAAVAGDGDWGMLQSRSMVHYSGTPAPGQAGNVIIAFHREPEFEHIDQMTTGDTIRVEDRACHAFTYKVTERWVLDPSKVTQLVPTSGHDLTLITCTPWWQDYQRIVWRASLVG